VLAVNRPFHKTVFHVWWDHLDGSSGKLVRSTKEFPRKEEAASFIRKTPHLIDRGAAGCYQLTESREVARDGKATVTSIRQDVWTAQEIAAMSRRPG
jgi:hypothetical protein